jgi:uncharacterized protein (DUF3820 family)
MATQTIGFANKFYTLWYTEKVPVYTTDSYGKHWLVGYNIRYDYLKNISFDLEKVKLLHPGLNINEELRGRTQSWLSENKDDLCPQIMKFGKYAGHDLNELVEKDFQYVLWLSENSTHSHNGKYARSMQKIQDHYQAIEENYTKISEKCKTIFGEILNARSFEFLAERNLKINGNIAYMLVNIDDCHITFNFQPGTFSWNEYNGFEYGLPIVKGKAKRMKGKNVRFEFIPSENDFELIVTNVTINK